MGRFYRSGLLCSWKVKFMTEKDKLDLLLNLTNSTILGSTPGDEFEKASEDTIAKEIRKAILSVRKGKCRNVDLSW